MKISVSQESGVFQKQCHIKYSIINHILHQIPNMVLANCLLKKLGKVQVGNNSASFSIFISRISKPQRLPEDCYCI